MGSRAAGAAFKDTWTLSDLDAAWMGLVADEQPAIYQVLQAAGLTHGKGMQSYLCMMAVRLVEMRRVLRETGSIYLHCDPYASHYLKQLMDAVFGPGNFRSDITWQRNSGRSKGWHGALSYSSDSDTILYYAKTAQHQFNGAYIELSEDEMIAKFPHVDERGRYNTDVPLFNQPSMGHRPNQCYTYKGVTNPHPSGWRVTRPRLEEMDRQGYIIWRGGKRPLRKSYADEYKGKPFGNVWVDIPMVGGAERTGYPTQKPLALLERIITASSNAGGVVLDPFCGCATACVAAENLGRRWVGIDLSPKAVELVNMRLQRAMGSLFHHGYVTARTDIPQRTDLVAPIPYRQNKHVLFGQQEGRCNGCKTEFPFRLFEVDHIVPQSRGGTDHLSNLQLLCGHCNRTKGDRPQEYSMAQLKKADIV